MRTSASSLREAKSELEFGLMRVESVGRSSDAEELAEKAMFVRGEYGPSDPRYLEVTRRLNDDALILTAGSFLACTPGVHLKTKFGGLRAFFSGEGAFFIECSGQGDLFYNAYGDVHEKQVDGALTIDTGHLVAWEPSLSYKIAGMGGLKQTLFSGEGLVMNFTGRGRLWVQTRHLSATARWLSPFLIG